MGFGWDGLYDVMPKTAIFSFNNSLTFMWIQELIFEPVRYYQRELKMAAKVCLNCCVHGFMFTNVVRVVPG